MDRGWETLPEITGQLAEGADALLDPVGPGIAITDTETIFEPPLGGEDLTRSYADIMLERTFVQLISIYLFIEFDPERKSALWAGNACIL